MPHTQGRGHTGFTHTKVSRAQAASETPAQSPWHVTPEPSLLEQSWATPNTDP